MTLEELIIANFAALCVEADEARHLASAHDDPVSIADLFKYAESFEADADLWELDAYVKDRLAKEREAGECSGRAKRCHLAVVPRPDGQGVSCGSFAIHS